MKKILMISLGLFLLLLTSCQKEQLDDQEINKSSIATSSPCSQSPILTFDTSQEFEDFMESIQVYEADELDDAPELDGFKSQKDLYDDLENQSEEEVCKHDPKDEIVDPYLSAVISPERELTIGAVTFQIGNEFVFGYLDCNGKDLIEEVIDKIRIGTYTCGIGEKKVYQEELLVYRVDAEVTDFEGGSDDGSEGLVEGDIESRESYSDENKFKNKRKVKGKIWQSNYFVYASMGVKTVMRKKKWCFWVNTDADKINVAWDLSLYFDAPGAPRDWEECMNSFIAPLQIDGSKTRYNEGKSSEVFASAAGIGISLTGGNLSGGTGVSTTGSPRFWRHRDNQISRSTHYVIYDGKGPYRVGPLEWDPCN